MMEEKSGFKKQNSKKGFQKNGHARSVEGILLVSVLNFRIPLLVRILSWPARHGQIKTRLSSHRSESDEQKSRTRRWGSLA